MIKYELPKFKQEIEKKEKLTKLPSCGSYDVITFGKYRGKTLAELPLDYRIWLRDEMGMSLRNLNPENYNNYTDLVQGKFRLYQWLKDNS